MPSRGDFSEFIYFLRPFSFSRLSGPLPPNPDRGQSLKPNVRILPHFTPVRTLSWPDVKYCYMYARLVPSLYTKIIVVSSTLSPSIWLEQKRYKRGGTKEITWDECKKCKRVWNREEGLLVRNADNNERKFPRRSGVFTWRNTCKTIASETGETQ